MRKAIIFFIMLLGIGSILVLTSEPAKAQITMLEMGVDGMI